MSGPRETDQRGNAGGTRPADRADAVADRVRRLVDQFRRELASGEAHDITAGDGEDLADLLEWKQAPGITTYDPSRFPELRRARETLVALGTASA